MTNTHDQACSEAANISDLARPFNLATGAARAAIPDADRRAHGRVQALGGALLRPGDLDDAERVHERQVLAGWVSP